MLKKLTGTFAGTDPPKSLQNAQIVPDGPDQIADSKAAENFSAI
jgi:hypothetical protein